MVGIGNPGVERLRREITRNPKSNRGSQPTASPANEPDEPPFCDPPTRRRRAAIHRPAPNEPHRPGVGARMRAPPGPASLTLCEGAPSDDCKL